MSINGLQPKGVLYADRENDCMGHSDWGGTGHIEIGQDRSERTVLNGIKWDGIELDGIGWDGMGRGKTR